MEMFELNTITSWTLSKSIIAKAGKVHKRLQNQALHIVIVQDEGILVATK